MFFKSMLIAAALGGFVAAPAVAEAVRQDRPAVQWEQRAPSAEVEVEIVEEKPPPWGRERSAARTNAEAYAALRAGLGVEGQQQRAAEAARSRRVATVQPHYASTHPWVQRPIAHAGWYLPPPPRPPIVRLPRPIIVRPIIFPPPRLIVPIPRRPWLGPPYRVPPWRDRPGRYRDWRRW